MKELNADYLRHVSGCGWFQDFGYWAGHQLASFTKSHDPEQYAQNAEDLRSHDSTGML